jgi:hypothetical protein
VCHTSLSERAAPASATKQTLRGSQKTGSPFNTVTFGLGQRAVQHQRLDAVFVQGGGDLVEVLDPVGQSQAAPAPPVGIGDIGRDQLVTRPVSGKLSVDGLDGGAVVPGSAVVKPVGCTMRCLAKVVWSPISWRIGPHCIVMIGSIWSAR